MLCQITRPPLFSRFGLYTDSRDAYDNEDRQLRLFFFYEFEYIEAAVTWHGYIQHYQLITIHADEPARFIDRPGFINQCILISLVLTYHISQSLTNESVIINYQISYDITLPTTHFSSKYAACRKYEFWAYLCVQQIDTCYPHLFMCSVRLN